MADRSPELVPSVGIQGTYYAATAGAGADRVPPGVLLHIKNASGAGITLSLVTRDIADGDLVVTDRTSISVPATTGSVLLRIPTNEFYRDPATGLVSLTWSAVTSVTFGVFT